MKIPLFASSTPTSALKNPRGPNQAHDIAGHWVLGENTITLHRRADARYVVKIRNTDDDSFNRFLLPDYATHYLIKLSETVPPHRGEFALAVDWLAQSLQAKLNTSTC